MEVGRLRDRAGGAENVEDWVSHSMAEENDGPRLPLCCSSSFLPYGGVVEKNKEKV